MFSKYYQSELAYLREMGRAFGLANPAVAGLLVERGGGPGRGAAARGLRLPDRAHPRAHGRRRAGDGARARRSCCCRTTCARCPASTIVEFTPQSRALRGRSRMPAGAEVASQPSGRHVVRLPHHRGRGPAAAARCTDVAAGPALAAPAGAARCCFQTTRAGPRGGVPARRACGCSSTASCRQRRCCCCGCCATAAGARARRLAARRGLELPPNAHPRRWASSRDIALLPWPRARAEGYRLLQEYFTLPAEVPVRRRARAGRRGGACTDERFELAFQFERPPPLPARVRRGDVPAALRAGGEPVQRAGGPDPPPRARRTSTCCAPRSWTRSHMEVYSVDAVTGLQAGAPSGATTGPSSTSRTARWRGRARLLPAAPRALAAGRRHRHVPRPWQTPRDVRAALGPRRRSPST